MKGIKTTFYTDVKNPILAGMGYGYNSDKQVKLHEVGYSITRIYFDTIQKDCTVGEERIKQVIYK
jgi:hypothetical protein